LKLHAKFGRVPPVHGVAKTGFITL